MRRVFKTEIKDGRRVTTQSTPFPMAWLYAHIAADHAVPLIHRGNKPVTTEPEVMAVMKGGVISVVALALTVEAAANQVGEDVFHKDFDDFEHCKGRFKKTLPKGTPAAVAKWYLLFREKGRENDFMSGVAPGLSRLFEARHALSHYKLTEHAEQWEAEAPFSPDFLVVFSAYDKFKRKKRGILAAIGFAAVNDFYATVRALLVLWREASGDGLPNVESALPLPRPAKPDAS